MSRQQWRSKNGRHRTRRAPGAGISGVSACRGPVVSLGPVVTSCTAIPGSRGPRQHLASGGTSVAEGVGWNGCSREHTDNRSGQGPHRSWSSSSWRRIGAGATGWGAASSSTFAAPFASRWSSHLLPAQGRPQARQGGVGLPRRTASSVHGTGRTCAVQTPCRAERDSAPLLPSSGCRAEAMGRVWIRGTYVRHVYARSRLL